MRRVALALLALTLVTCSSETDDGDNDSALSGTTAATTASGAPENITLVAEGSCADEADHTVIISDFAYSPSFLNVKVGETVAWINLESCPSMPLEDLVVPIAGCDTHHEVVTFPSAGGTDSVDSGHLCSPFPGVPGGTPGIDLDNCAIEGGSNVFCHTFTEPGMQHYTCFVNPGHTLLMHGFINVSE